MLLFCPTCANLLVAQEDECYQFVCSTCPYVHKVTRLVSHFLLTGLRETNFGAETETPKASRLKCRRRWERGAEGGVMWGSCVPSLLGVRSGSGLCLFPENFWIFHLKSRVLVHPERHFCQEMLAGYRNYNTMFCWPSRYSKTEMSQPMWQQTKNTAHLFPAPIQRSVSRWLTLKSLDVALNLAVITWYSFLLTDLQDCAYRRAGLRHSGNN